MKPEKQQLIHELLEGESRSESTLLAATKILRRRRQWRAARQAVAMIALAVVAVWLAGQNNPRRMSARVSPPETKVAAPLQAQSLTDAELLALFPNTPVGLAKLPNGKKLLVFPRPADAAKYITRL
jgi:hypothetical protein